MKKIALAFVASMLVAAPAVACPGMEGGHGDNTPKTAEKKEAPKKEGTEKKADAPAKTTEKKTDAPAKTAKPEKAPEKKADKVSSR